MDACPHFITSGLCCLYWDLGQKRLQNSLGAYSVNSDTWPLSRGRVIWSFSLPRGRVSHATASCAFCLRRAVALVMRSHRCFFASGTRSRRPCHRVNTSFLQSSVLPSPSIFVCFLFHPLSHSALENLKLLNTLITASNGNKGN